jgi:Ca2+:H+ antiporter
MSADVGHGTPAWSWLLPAGAAGLLGLEFAHVVPPGQLWKVALATILLGGSVFSAVHHAEVLALRLGEPIGSILLTVAVTVIEVGLIISIQLSDAPNSGSVARDTVFSALMIVLNGVVGLCLVLGANRHREQNFQLQGAVAALTVLGTLAVLSLVLPNHTAAAPGPFYAPAQLVFVAVVSVALYLTFVFVQTVRHPGHFLDTVDAAEAPEPHAQSPRPRVVAASACILPVSLAAVILLAEELSHPLERGIAAADLPQSVAGVAIAMLVLLPEGLASVRATLRNRLQTSLNLGLGSAIASIGLSIPTVAAASLVDGRPLTLGLSDENTVLLVLTLFISTLTLGTGRTTVLQGAVHLMIFAVFLLLSVVP